ncbi:MAG: ATP synthase F1 subunit delta [Phycisphaeraceae bacterium]
MPDDERKSLWRRLKDKLTGKPQPTPGQTQDQAEDQSQQDIESGDEAPALRADEPQQAPPTTEPTEPLAPPIEPLDPQPEPEPPSPPTPAEDGEPSVLSTSELKTDTVGRVYAEALLELAQDQGAVDELADEIQQLLPVIASGGELDRLLTNPAISDAERGKIIRAVFEGKVSGLLYNLLRLLSDKGRLGSLPQVAAGYLLAVADLRGQVDVEAFVADELDAQTAKDVADQIGRALGKTVTLRQKVDPSLIGGLKIKVGDQLIDASVASQLRNMKNKMIAAGRS